MLDKYPPLVVAFVLAIAAALFLNFSEISLTGLGAQDIGTKFLSLAFMALIIERSVEIYIQNRFGDEEASLKRDMRVAAKSVRLYTDAVATANAAPVIGEDAAATQNKVAHVVDLQGKLEAARRALLDNKKTAEPALQALRSRRKRAATIAALFLSLAVAVVGLRILAQFVPTLPAANADPQDLADVVVGTYQLQAFHAIDIVLTTLLLSGGADGLHHLVKDFLSDRDALLGG